MKTPTKLSIALVSALSIAGVAHADNVETTFVVKPANTYSEGTDIGAGYKRIVVDNNLSEEQKLSSLKNSGDFLEVNIDRKMTSPTSEKNVFFTETLDTVNGQSSEELSLDDPYLENQTYLLSSSKYSNGTNLQLAADYLAEVNGTEGETVRVLVVDGSFYENDEIPYSEGYSFASDRDDGKTSRKDFIALEEAGSCSKEHGTAIASIYGAKRDNGESIAGAVPNVEMVAAEALVCDEGYTSDIASSMLWGAGEKVGDAVNISEPVDVINLSLGTNAECSPYFQSVIDFAVNSGIQVHVSAGNCENVMTTGALGAYSDTLADFSNYGDNVDVYAQGVGILGLDAVEGSVSSWNGTSFAVGLTGSTGALLKSHYPDVTPLQAYWFIKRSSRLLTNSPECNSGNCEKGQLDALAAAVRANEYFTAETTTIKPVLHAGEECLSGQVGTYFTEEMALCGLYEVSFEADSDKNGVTYRLHATDKTSANGASFVVLETPESAIVTRDIDVDSFNYHYSVCTNGECEVSPLEFTVDETTPAECQ
jgi:hypothetical protein